MLSTPGTERVFSFYPFSFCFDKLCCFVLFCLSEKAPDVLKFFDLCKFTSFVTVDLILLAMATYRYTEVNWVRVEYFKGLCPIASKLESCTAQKSAHYNYSNGLEELTLLCQHVIFLYFSSFPCWRRAYPL